MEVDTKYDGALISEYGVKKYLYGNKNQAFSNIQIFQSNTATIKNWKECNFGCHGPSYRTLKKEATWNSFLTSLDKIDPLLSGVVDGIHHKTIHQTKVIASGIERTAEGLHLLGSEKFNTVGGENTAAYDFAKTTFTKLIELDLENFENPFSQGIFVVVNEYISLLPEWVIQESLSSGQISFSNLDEALALKTLKSGLTEAISSDEARQALQLLRDKGKRLIGKAVGKKIAAALAAIIAAHITRKIIHSGQDKEIIKRKLAGIRKEWKKANGGLGAALMVLLKSQGLLGLAAKGSRSLQADCPKLWSIMRYKMHGTDMIYFLFRGFIQEYVDRLSLLEKQPAEFARVMRALIRDKRTTQIYFPGALN